jgi:hypothetical protein
MRDLDPFRSRLDVDEATPPDYALPTSEVSIN